jgi:predicted amidohydrolase
MVSPNVSRRSFLGAAATGMVTVQQSTSVAIEPEDNLLEPVLRMRDAQTCRPWAPRENLQPHCRRVNGKDGSALQVESNGSIGCHGGWEIWYNNITPGTAYRFCVTAHVSGTPHPVENISPEIYFFGQKSKHLDWQFVDAVETLGDQIRFEKIVTVPSEADRLAIRLILRWTAHGIVTFSNMSLTSAETQPGTQYRAAVAAGFPQQKTVDENLATCLRVIREAADNGAEFIVLPETITSWRAAGDYWDNARPIPGKETDALSDCARQQKISIALSVVESVRDLVHNTGLIFGSNGEIQLKYRKLQLAVGERQSGMTPGDDLPVTHTDLGCLGMQICYDNTHGETLRVLAAKGAEVVAMPIMGDPRSAVRGNRFSREIWDMIMRMRALDNHVWFLVARNDGPGSCIVNPAGEIVATMGEGQHLIYADIDIGFRNWSWSGSDFLDRYWRERRPSAFGPVASTGFYPV